MRATKTIQVALGVLLVTGLLQDAYSQGLQHIHTFSTFRGAIQFLPGAHVIVEESGRVTHYVFQKDKFVKSTAVLPKFVRTWKSFDWESVDNLNQVDHHNFDPSINGFLPPARRVKKIVYLPHGAKEDIFVLICYTLPTQEEFARPDSTDIFLKGLRRVGAADGYKYEELWVETLQSDADYGDLSVQDVPGVGWFVVLYWQSVGGSGTSQGLNIYRLAE